MTQQLNFRILFQVGYDQIIFITLEYVVYEVNFWS